MDLHEISVQLQAGKAKIVKTLVQQAIDEGISAQTILEEGLLDGMNVIGEKFKNNEVFVPEVLISARAMNQGVGVLKPLLSAAGVDLVQLANAIYPTEAGLCISLSAGGVYILEEGRNYELQPCNSYGRNNPYRRIPYLRCIKAKFQNRIDSL